MNSNKQEFAQSISGQDADRRVSPTNSNFSKDDFSLLQPPQISLPKGGGAIRGIDEKYTVNPVTGTGGTSIPIHISPGRQGFGPQLSVVYNSGQGNSAFGLGWDLTPPAITRKTDRGLPRYNDTAESDIYTIIGAEDLVPELVEVDGEWSRWSSIQNFDGVEYEVHRYRPRTEGAFVRIERWVRRSDGDTHWRTLSPDNLLTVYGKDQNSRINAPGDSSKIFKWLLSESRDDKGNAIFYEYKAENGIGIDLSESHERNRGKLDSEIRKNNKYIKRIKYGNQVPFLTATGLRPFFVPQTQIDNAAWMFEVLFDYGEGHLTQQPPLADGTKIVQIVNQMDENAAWPVRQDPYSSHRARFEIRTYRLCQRILMFHHFPDELDGIQDYLISSTEFVYEENPVASLLTSVIQAGYIHESDNRFRQEAYPPVEFTYSQVPLQDGIQPEDLAYLQVKEVSPDQLENIPAGMSNIGYRWVDLNGEGLSGILIEQGNTWFYKPNLGSGHFGGLETINPRPSSLSLNSRSAQLLDLSGNGQLDIAVFDGAVPGFFQRSQEEGWDNHQPFKSVPKIEWKDPNLRMVDLTGDGLVDLLITEDSVMSWYPSEGEEGFGRRERVFQALEEEKGPRLLFTQEGESALLADMSGDGLADIVRVRNGEVVYWPNEGYGSFGAKVSMDNAPLFDLPERFDPRRIRLADVAGSGIADILYLDNQEVSIYRNQSGNSWSSVATLTSVPKIDHFADVQVVDLLGNGTACLVWSSPLSLFSDHSMKYIDLMNSQKPYLLVGVKNNLGAETKIHYAPSTEFYLDDKLSGKKWATHLPFPVQVVETVEFIDHVSKHRYASSYRYHHGYFDGLEREFRGFGMVEQQDTETFEDYVIGVAEIGGDQELAPEFYQPPVTTRTWYHLGAYFGRDKILHQFSSEYYQGTQLLPEPQLPDDLDETELHESIRALRGTALRQETYSFDGSAEEYYPYQVTESTHAVLEIQPRGPNEHAVFRTYGIEGLSLVFDRKPDDPRISHTFTLEVDDLGNPHKAGVVVYGRTSPDASLPGEISTEQQKLYISYGEVDFTDDIDSVVPVPNYRLRIPYEGRSYEITGIEPDGDLFKRDEIKTKIESCLEIGYEIVADGTSPQQRMLSHNRTVFMDNSLAPLPLGQWDTLGLVYQNYQLAFTPDTITFGYEGDISASDLTSAGYTHFDGDSNWWMPSGIAVYPENPQDHFFIPNGTKDPSALEVIATYDNYDLLVEEVQVTQAAWNHNVAVNDYRLLGPVMLTGPNGNRAAVETDALGRVISSAVMGKQGAGEGDTLADPTTRFEYELFNWVNNGLPNFVRLLAREKHGAENPRWQESYAYSSGVGSVVLVKSQTSPGKALQVNPDNSVTEVDADPRWIGTGRTIVNNKGNPVKQYEPYFSTTHLFEDEKAVREIGITAIQFYDAAGRALRKEFPDGTLTRVEYDPWFQKGYDSIDTVLESQWYLDRGSPDPSIDPEPVNDPEKRAAWLATKHANTPGTVYLDSLGRTFFAVADGGGGSQTATRSESDLTGRFTRQFDQLGREISSTFAGMLGTTIKGQTAEKGEQWSFTNIYGALVKSWDEYGRTTRMEYDQLHRPVSSFSQEAGETEILVSHLVFGDRHPTAAQHNLLGTAHLVFDQGGLIKIPELDFKGNPLEVERFLSLNYQQLTDWNNVAAQTDYADIEPAAAVLLKTDEVFTTSSLHDALSRPTQVILPDATILKPAFNEANQLTSLDVQVRGGGDFINVLQDQAYDAKGQRQYAFYGNGLVSRYIYDPFTYRLTNLFTHEQGVSPVGNCIRDLKYTFDPAGNITQIRDDAQQTFFFNNSVVKPESLFEYDANYQLIRATGREHASLTNDTIITSVDLDFIPELPHTNNSAAVRKFTEEYTYDSVGNIKTLRHHIHNQNGLTSDWTRRYRYTYEDAPTDRTNRLSATSVPGDPAGGPYSATYSYDDYGNMTSMPHLADIKWNNNDQIKEADLGGGGKVYYVYAAGGQRIRKVIERSGGAIEERIYLGGVEIFREYQADTTLHFERQTLHISDSGGQIAQVDTKTLDDLNSDPDNGLGTSLIRYQYGNHLGSACLETNENGDVISYEEYHPYGTSAYRSSKPGFSLSLKRYRFSGKERDDETGLYYFGARYYAPWLGRWTSSDPAGLSGGFNMFRYCSNNPIMFMDPNGMDDYSVLWRYRASEYSEEERAVVTNPESNPADVLRILEAHGYPHGGPLEWRTDFGSSGGWVRVRPAPAPPAGGAGGGESSSAEDPSINPVPAATAAVRGAAAPRARSGPLSTTLRDTPGGTPRSFPPNASLEGEVYNLWSGGVNPPGGTPTHITPGSGADEAMRAPGFIMEDTAAEEAAEALARYLTHPDRFNVPYSTDPASDFARVWGPGSDEMAVRAGLSQMTWESHGLGTHPAPGRTVQVTREIPRIVGWGGVMAQAGKVSGIFTIAASTGVENTTIRWIGYGAGATEFVAGNSYLLGTVSVGSGYFSTSTTSGLMTFGRVGGRIGGGVGMIALSGYALVTDYENGNYGVMVGDAAGMAGGGAILLGSGPGAAIAIGVVASNTAGDWVESAVTPRYGRTTGVAAGTAAGAGVGAAAGAAIGVWFFGVGAAPGALIGGAVGGIVGFIGAYW